MCVCVCVRAQCVYAMSWFLLLFVFVNLNVQNKRDVYSEALLCKGGATLKVLGRSEVATTWSRAVGKDRGVPPHYTKASPNPTCAPNLTGSARSQGQTHPLFPGFLQEGCKEHGPTWKVSQF